MSAKRFDVALSFSGEHRDFVAGVARELATAFGQERVVYDRYFEAEFARPDLDVYLPRLYREDSELVVIFLCPEYQQKRWCRLEWRHIRQFIATADAGRIMFVSFGSPGDLSEIGILSGDGYVDIGRRTPAAIAQLILQRAGQPIAPQPLPPAPRVQTVGNLRPRTPWFVGRTAELGRLDEALCSGRVGVVTAVHGLGGMGKTELAVAYAESQAARFQAGLWSLGAEGKKEFLPLLGELVFAPELNYAPTDAQKADPALLGRAVLAAALRYFTDAKDIAERLAASDPTNVTWQKDVVVSRRLVAEVRGQL